MSDSSVQLDPRATRRRRPVQAAALASGVVFLLVGAAGFVPGLTSDYSTMGLAGPDSHAMLVGVFMVSALHNVVHLLYGVVGVAAARTASAARTFLVVGGVVYLVLWVYGLVVDQASSANFVPLNTADNWLHLVLGVVMVGAGLVLGRRTSGDLGSGTPM